MLPPNNDNERLYPLEGLIGIENCIQLEKTGKLPNDFFTNAVLVKKLIFHC